MPIYEQALSPQKILRQQSTGLLGMGQPANLGPQSPIPQTSVGNVDFLEGRVDERQSGIDRQQQLLSSLVDLGGTAAVLGVEGYDAYKNRGGGGFSNGSGSLLRSERPSYFGFRQQGAGDLNPILGYGGGGGGFGG